MPTIAMKAPAGAPGSVSALSGNQYTPDAFGFINVQYGDIVSCLNAGYIVAATQATGAARRDTFTATTNPLVTNDSSQDFAIDSHWYNINTGMTFQCVDATVGAAVWQLLSPAGSVLIAKLIGANMNVVTDQVMQMMVDKDVKYRVTKITGENASISLTTAAGGVYDAAAKGGNAVVAATQVYTVMTAANQALDLTVATAPAKLIEPAGTLLYLALTTGQGAAATADFYVFGDIVA